MKMISTRRQNSLSLSGGHIISDSLNIPSYSPNAVSTSIVQPFPWDDQVDDINTPDIDPSFFDNGPLFKKFNSQTSIQMDQMDILTADDNIFLLSMAEQTN